MPRRLNALASLCPFVALDAAYRSPFANWHPVGLPTRPGLEINDGGVIFVWGILHVLCSTVPEASRTGKMPAWINLLGLLRSPFRNVPSGDTLPLSVNKLAYLSLDALSPSAKSPVFLFSTVLRFISFQSHGTAHKAPPIEYLAVSQASGQRT